MSAASASVVPVEAPLVQAASDTEAGGTPPDEMTTAAVARGEFDRWRGERSKWELDESKSRATVARIDAGAAGEVLANPTKLAAIAKRRAELEGRAGIAAQAAVEAERRAGISAAAVARAEAKGLDAEIEAAEVEVAEFEGETARLLQALTGHTGQVWRVWTVDDELTRRRDSGISTAFSWPNGRLPALQDRAAGLVRRKAILLAAADGRDLHAQFPGIGFADLPECLHPVTGVLPQVGFRDPVAFHAEQLAEAEALLADAEETVVSFDQRITRSEARVVELEMEGRGRDAYDLRVSLPDVRRERDRAAMSMHNLRASVERLSA